MPSAGSPHSSAAPSSRQTYHGNSSGGASLPGHTPGLTHSSSVSSRLSIASSSSSSQAPSSSFATSKSASSPAVITADDSEDFRQFLDQAHAQEQSRPKAKPYNLSPGASRSRPGASESLRRVASSSTIDNQQRPSISPTGRRSDQAAPAGRVRKNSTLSTASAARRSVSSTIYRNPTTHFLQQLSSEAQTPELGLDDTPIAGRPVNSRNQLTALGHAVQLQSRSKSATYAIGKGKVKAVVSPLRPEIAPAGSKASEGYSMPMTLASSSNSNSESDLSASTSTIIASRNAPASTNEETSQIGLGLPSQLQSSSDTMTTIQADDMNVDEVPQTSASDAQLSPAAPDAQKSPASSTRTWFGLVRPAPLVQSKESESNSQPKSPVLDPPPPPMNEDEAAFRRNLGYEVSIPAETAIGEVQTGTKGVAAETAPALDIHTTERRTSWLPWRQYSSQIEEAAKPTAKAETVPTGAVNTKSADIVANEADAGAATHGQNQGSRPSSTHTNTDTETIKYRTVLKRGWMGARYEVQEPIPRVQKVIEDSEMPAAVELKPEALPLQQTSGTTSSIGPSQPQTSGQDNRSTSGAWRWRVWGGSPKIGTCQDVHEHPHDSVSEHLESAKASSQLAVATASSTETDAPVEGTIHEPQVGESWTYSSYLASWVPTWVYDADLTQDVAMAQAEEEVPAQPRTPAEQVKADALARDTSYDNTTKAILNDRTRSGWINFFASRSANPPRPMPGLVKDADGMEVMDISDMGETGGSWSSSQPSAPKAAAAKQIATATKGKNNGTLAANNKGGSRASSVTGGEELTRPATPLLSTSKESVKQLGKAALAKAANATAASGLGLGKGKRQDSGHSRSVSVANSIAAGGKDLAVEKSMPPRSGASTPVRGVNDPASKFSPNLVLPSFDDSFGRAPRMWAPKVSMLERTLSAVNSYLFSKVPDLERMNRPTRYSTYGNDEASNISAGGGALRSKRSGQHLAGKSKVTGLGSSKDKGVEQALKEVAELTQRLPREFSTAGLHDKAQTKGTLGISKIVVIGVHGWFTQSIFKTMIGEATGTSSKFAAMQAESVRRHFLEAGLELNPEAITVISLQGDGKVADRVNRLFSEMISRPKWVNDMKEADAIFLSAHSQGAIVATQLLARLIEQRHIQSERTRICLLAMCGIHHGPFAHLKSSVTTSYINYFETAAAKELFEFQSSSTRVSQQHTAALRTVLDAGAKCVYVGSTDDNVVPIYSALNSGNNHPSILRALYIDGQAFPKVDFLTNLLVMCVAVRNAGLNDYNLLTLLSASVAGSLYGGTGHSNVYEERAVYDLATRYLFEVTHPLNEPTLVPGLSPLGSDTDTKGAPTLASEPFEAQRWNPYELPWSLRGLFEDKHVRSLFAEDILNLLNSYEEWKPDVRSKALKDLQWRLAPMRSIARPMIQEEPSTGPYHIGQQGDSPEDDSGQTGKAKNAKL